MSSKCFKLKILPKASEDLDSIFRYISEELFNNVATEKLLSEFEEGFRRICNFPYSCPLTQTEIKYRKLIVNNYIAFYLVDEVDESVIVFRVLYGMMDYNKYL